MTGPDHYRDAEELLEKAEDALPGSEDERYCLAAAQAHATLALAAATALAVRLPATDAYAWVNAVTTPAAEANAADVATDQHPF